jgi:hypothetical protein
MNLGMVELQIKPEELVRPTVIFERLQMPVYKQNYTVKFLFKQSLHESTKRFIFYATFLKITILGRKTTVIYMYVLSYM